MAFTLETVVPWGRSLAEYRRMFNLTDADLRRRIVGCGDGPASFNAEATGLGANVISCDPLYQYSRDEIAARIEATFDHVIEQTARNRQAFVWETIRSVEELGATRNESMQRFLRDYNQGLASKRYLAAELPTLPFVAKTFDLALCSHFLFLYSEQVSEEVHLASLLEMCRVAKEVRIFPLIALDGTPSKHLPAAVEAMRATGFSVTVQQVDYEFQRGANKMLVVNAAHGEETE